MVGDHLIRGARSTSHLISPDIWRKVSAVVHAVAHLGSVTQANDAERAVGRDGDDEAEHSRRVCRARYDGGQFCGPDLWFLI